jgi:hypothetical protein
MFEIHKHASVVVVDIVEDQASAARLVLEEVRASCRKHKSLDQSSQVRVDPDASLQYNRL